VVVASRSSLTDYLLLPPPRSIMARWLRIGGEGELMEWHASLNVLRRNMGWPLARRRFRTGGKTRFWLTLLQCLRSAIACKQCQLFIEFATKPLACHAGAVIKSGALGTLSCGCVTDHLVSLYRGVRSSSSISNAQGGFRCVARGGAIRSGLCDVTCDGSESGIG
jgi:hypothetical protein